ncbi:DUF4097 family beta strand repeat-containing protein [Tamaricihabitans halophyticus]|nr:DUF4097 family beta strand repeat-containing protein [Tamaricihabitans halophyticus]
MAVAGVALIGVGAAVAFGWVGTDTAEAENNIAERVRSVEIDNQSGDVTIRATDTQQTKVHQSFRYRWGEPDEAYELDGDNLVLNGCGWGCDVSYQVEVPRDVLVTGKASSGNVTLTEVGGVDVQANSGNIEVRRAAGEVRTKASSGNITLVDLTGPVFAEANSGNIRGDQLGNRAEVQASSGDITLNLASPQSVTASASSGDVEVGVPDGRYRVTTETNGTQEIGVASDDSASHVLDLEASSGDVTVRTLGR